MDVEEGLDTGGVHAVAEVPIEAGTTAAELRETLTEVGTGLMVDVLAQPLAASEPQSAEGVTYAEKLTTEDLHLDWFQPAAQLARVVAVGGAWTTLEGRRLKVLQARALDADEMVGAEGVSGREVRPGELVDKVVLCGEGALELSSVQPEGKGPMAADAFLRGARIGPDTRLGT